MTDTLISEEMTSAEPPIGVGTVCKGTVRKGTVCTGCV
jgi:hypothetical protein